MKTLTLSWDTEEVRNAIKICNARAKEIDLALCPDLKTKIHEKYTGNKYHIFPTWEHLRDSLAVRKEFAWEWFEDMLKNKEIILFFEHDRDRGMFYFEDGAELPQVLENCYGFVFYISNWNTDFLLAYNDHDNLIACGEAKEWLRNYPKVRELGLEIYESISKDISPRHA
jgi:hypothetical protein